MTATKKLSVVAVLGVVVLALPGCGSSAEQRTSGSVCQLPAGQVQAAVGTDQLERFEVKGSFPVAKGSPPVVRCAYRVEGGKGHLFDVTSTNGGPQQVSDGVQQVRAARQHLMAGRVPVRYAETGSTFSANAVCGSVVTSVTGPRMDGATTAERQRVVRAAVQRAGCHSATGKGEVPSALRDLAAS